MTTRNFDWGIEQPNADSKPAAAKTTTSGGGTPPKKTKRKKRKLRWGRIFAVLLCCALVCCIGVAAYVASVLKDLPEWDENALFSDQTTFLYDNNGEIFSEIHSSENRTYVTLDDMPDYLIDAFLATEDARFYEHHGIDLIRLGGALVVDLKTMSSSQGASTITMQLARTAILNNQDKKIARKIKEAVIAIQLENEYSKDEILALYLNEIYFGHSAYGVQAASQTLFGKDVKDIDMAEAATLVGIIRNPRMYSPLYDAEASDRVKRQVLKNLEGYTDKYDAEEIAAAKEEVVQTGESAYAAAYNHPWYTDYVIDLAEDIIAERGYEAATIYTGGWRIYTTLNETVQSLMETAYSLDSNFPETYSDDLVESAMVVLDNENSAILGLVGGREYTTKRGYNRATAMKRQPGSTFKPVADYAPAIEAGYSPATVANDVKTTFGTTWTPNNYDGSYKGIISMRTACQYSVNIASVKFLQMATVDASLQMLSKLGIDLDKEHDNNLSIALGGITYGVSPLQMAAAYGALANSGVYTEPWCISRIEDSDGQVIYESELNQTVAMKETTAYLVTDMLKTVTTSGTGSRAQLPNRDVASKTGTVQLPDLSYFKGLNGNRDAWFAAFTPEMVGVVWMGYDHDQDDNGKVQYLRQIYGGKYPALIWRYVIGGASSGLPESRFKQPAGIVSLTVDKMTGLLPSDSTTETVTELFDKDNIPTTSGEAVTAYTLCAETNLLATDNCAETKTIYRMAEPDPSNTIGGAYAFVPTAYCTKHQATATPDITDDPTADSPTDNKPVGGETANTDGSLYAPTGFTAAKRSDSTVYVNWTDDNTGNVKYQVEYWQGSDSPSRIITYFYDLTVNNLTAGGTYNFRVRATTDAEDSFSNWSNTVTVTLD